MAQVSLGNFFNANGRQVLGGVGGSGVDTETIVKALTDAKAVPAKNLKDKVDINGKTKTALAEFKTLLSKFKDAANFLRNPPGVANDSDNVFQYRKSSVSSNTSTVGSSYLSVTASPGAQLQSYTIDKITAIAAAKKQKSETFAVADANTSVVVASGPTSSQFKAGTIVVKGQSITLTAGDSLNTIAAKFNTVSKDTHIQANVVQLTSSGNFILTFSATATGTLTNFDLTDKSSNPLSGADVIDQTGVLNEISFSTTQAVSNASFVIDGETITRQSNSINDVIPGLSFNLLQATPDDLVTPTDLTVAITADTELAKSGISNFINAYNDLRTFAAKQTELSADGTLTADALLARNTTFRNTTSDVGNVLAAVVEGLDSDVFSRLADIGITFTDLPASKDNPFTRNILTADEGKLDAALSGSFDEVRDVFEFSFNSSNPNIRAYGRTNTLGATAFNLNVVFSKATVQKTAAFTLADSTDPVVTASATAGFFKAGTFTFKGAQITLTDGQSLLSVMNAFNTVSTTTGVTASIENPSAGQYKLVFTANTKGTAKAFDFNSSTYLTSDPGSVFGNLTISTTQAAANDSFTATVSGSSVDVDVTAVTGGYAVKGKAGTALEGLTMVAIASGDFSSSISVSQGIGDRIFNILDSVLKADTGALAIEGKALDDYTTKMEDEIKKIDDQVAVFREQMLAKFAALEQTVSRVNSLLTSLDAQDKARQNS